MCSWTINNEHTQQYSNITLFAMIGHIYVTCPYFKPLLLYCLGYLNDFTNRWTNEWMKPSLGPAFPCFGLLSSLMIIHMTARESHHCQGGKHHNHSLGPGEEHLGQTFQVWVFCFQVGSGEQCPSSPRLYLDGSKIKILTLCWRNVFLPGQRPNISHQDIHYLSCF